MRTKSKTRRLKQKGGILSQFVNLCKSGNLAGAKEYLRLHPDTNLSQDNEKAFRFACYFGRLELAQWLLQVRPDINISANNHEAFRLACREKHLDIVKWLETLKAEYEVIVVGTEVIFYCNILTDPAVIAIKKKDRNWERRKPVAFLASQPPGEAGKDNLLARVPTDVARITGSYL